MSRTPLRLLVCAGALALAVGLVTQLAAQHAALAPLAPLTNPILNAPDSTEHDTQSTAAIILGTGSNVITAFLNTALNNGSNKHQVGWSRSTNGGTNWSDMGSLPASAAGDFFSPVLAREQSSGKIYLSTMNFGLPPPISGVQMFRSTDDGATWAAPVNAMPGFGGNDMLQHPWTAVDNVAGTGQNYVYVTARNNAGGGGGSQPAGVYLSRSTDGGATFTMSPAGVLSGGGLGPSVAVGTDHAVYVFWWINLNPAVIRFVKSTNQGVSFGPITTAATLNTNAGDLGLGFYTDSFPHVAVNPVSGALYVVYNDKGPGADKADILVVASGNGGTNWDGPFLVNFDGAYTPNHDQFMPTMAVTPDGKRGLITWYDRRSDPNNLLIERWAAVATFIAPDYTEATISPNFRVSTGSWPVAIGQDTYVGPTYMGLYDTAAADNNFFYIPWGDNRVGNPASSPHTPLPHAHQPDVRFAKIPVTGPPLYDTDRDLQSDRTIFRPTSGVWYTAQTSGGGIATGWGTTGDVDVMGDYDGDEKADLAVFRPPSGLWFILRSSNGGVGVTSFGVSGDIPLAGDFDGDGSTDLTVFRPSNGTWFVRTSSQGDVFAAGWGINGDIPLTGDFNGDGFDDFAIYRPSSGVWYIFYPATQTSTIVGWGINGDIPVSGDFDGDGIADPTVFRPSSGQWLVQKSTGGVLSTTWGLPGDIPVTGDWDGDGKSDFTVWRETNGVWFTQFASGGSAVVGWGISGDKPTGRVPGS